MSAVSTQTVIKLVNSVSTLLSFLDDITNLPINTPSLYLDLEGVNLSRLGSISIMSLHVAPTKKTYLVDIYVLGNIAFSTTNGNGDSLKAILESANIPKVFFDIRNDSDALFSNHQISVDGIKDLQLMELAARNFSREFVSGLAKCVENDCAVSRTVKDEWQRVKDSASRLYNPKKGGRYEVFNERPMTPEIVQYCAQDVAVLPELWNVYSAKLDQPRNAFWRYMVRNATKERIKLSQSESYDGQAKSKARGPWDPEQIEMERDAWNDNVLMNAHLGYDSQ